MAILKLKGYFSLADLSYLTIKKAHRLLQEGGCTALELTKYYLDRLDQQDKIVASSLTICRDQALASAREVDKKIARGQSIGLLEGIPYTAKDMFLTKGVRTTAASKILDGFVAPYSATVIEKLEMAGAILLAKVNQDEFAHGGSTENSAYHPTHNPWNKQHVPGGSSGGSAAAVAVDIGVFSLGTDTGGSIRQPASFCGVVGFKPTYGLVSRFGVVAMASSLDVIGPLARSVEDVALVLDVIAGRDERDATTIELDNYDFSNALKSKQALKIGLIKEHIDNLDEANRKAFDSSCEELKKAGHQLSEVSLGNIEMALPCYYILTPSEISSNLERYDGIRYGSSSQDAKDLLMTYKKTRGQFFGPEVKRRILTGTYTLSAGYYDAYYKKAMQVRTLIKKSFDRAFVEYDILAGPTTPTPAFELGAMSDPVQMYQSDIMTAAVNLAGIPALSQPAGLVEGLPVGLQLMAAQGDDAKLLATATTFESQVGWHERRVKV